MCEYGASLSGEEHLGLPVVLVVLVMVLVVMVVMVLVVMAR